MTQNEKTIIRDLQNFTETFNEYKNRFEKKMGVNFLNALEWAENTAVAAAESNIAAGTLAIWEKRQREFTLRQVIEEGLKEMKENQGRYYASTSTSMFSNAVDQATAQARVRMINRFESFLRGLKGN